jgi:hypothetical protein
MNDVKVTMCASGVQSSSSDFRASSPAHAVCTDTTKRRRADNKKRHRNNSNRRATSRRATHARRRARLSVHRASSRKQQVHATARSSAFTRTCNISMDGPSSRQKLSAHAQRHADSHLQAAVHRGARHAERVPPVVVCQVFCKAASQGQHGGHFPRIWSADCRASLAPSGAVPPQRVWLAYERCTE